MNEIVAIENLKVGNSIKLFALCSDKSLRKTKNGDLYIDLHLRDRENYIYAKVWSNVEHFKQKFKIGDIVFVKGKVESYRKNKQINVSSIGRIDRARYQKYGFSLSLIYSFIDEDLVGLWEKVLNHTKQLSKQYISTLKAFVLLKKDFLIDASCIDDIKYQVKGCLLKDLHVSLNTSIEICRLNDSINKNVVIISLFLKYVAISELLNENQYKFPDNRQINKLCKSHLKSFGMKEVFKKVDLFLISKIFSNALEKNKYNELILINDLDELIQSLSVSN